MLDVYRDVMDRHARDRMDLVSLWVGDHDLEPGTFRGEDDADPDLAGERLATIDTSTNDDCILKDSDRAGRHVAHMFRTLCDHLMP